MEGRNGNRDGKRGNLLIPDSEVVLVPFEADLKIVVVGYEFEDC